MCEHCPQRYPPVTTAFRSRGKTIRVHALCSGTVSIKQPHFQGRSPAGEGLPGRVSANDHHLPIWVWVIEHPEGIVVVDTGELAGRGHKSDAVLSRESKTNRLFSHPASVAIAKEEELQHLLAAVQLCASKIAWVVLTHLHPDHTGGLGCFQHQEIVLCEQELVQPCAHLELRQLPWAQLHAIRFSSQDVVSFNKGYPLTSSGDLMLVPTPGHTHGHSSLLLVTDQCDILFAGDVSLNQQQVLRWELGGVNANHDQAFDTYNKIRSYALNKPLLYLPAHDEAAATRLVQRQYLQTPV